AGIVLHLVAPFGGIRRGEEENSSVRQSRANPFQSGERGEIEMLQHFGHEDYIEDARRRYGVELNIALREVEAARYPKLRNVVRHIHAVGFGMIDLGGEGE